MLGLFASWVSHFRLAFGTMCCALIMARMFALVRRLNRALFGSNLYRAHVEKLIECHILPFRSYADFIDCKKPSSRRLKEIAIIMCILLLNLFRFVAIAVCSNESAIKRDYLMDFFHGQPNHRLFNITLILMTMCPTFLYIKVLQVGMSPREYIFHYMILDMIEGRFHLPHRRIVSLNRGMRLLHLFHIASNYLSPCIVATFPLLDYLSKDTSSQSWLSFGLFLFWNSILIISVRQIISICLLLIQHSFLVTWYMKLRYLHLKSKLAKSIHRIVRLQSVNANCGRIELHCSRAGRSLQTLGELALLSLRFREQIKYMALFIHVCLFAGIEFDLYLLIDYRTTPLLRSFVINEIPFIASIVIVLVFFTSDFSSKAKSILIELNQCLHRVPFINRHDPYEKLMLAERQAMVASDRISVSMAAIYCLVRLEILRSFCGLVNYLLLIIDVNR